MIKELYESILAKQKSNAVILEIFKTGSQILRTNPSDFDFVAICSGYEKPYHREMIFIDGKKYDLIIQDTITIKRIVSFETYISSRDFYTASLYSYFYSIRETIYGSYDINWNMLDHKETYINYLRNMYKGTIGKRINRTKLTKGWVHYYVIIKIFENNNFVIDSEMKTIINKLYLGGPECEEIICWIEDKLNL